jgi:hypothetical protein
MGRRWQCAQQMNLRGYERKLPHQTPSRFQTLKDHLQQASRSLVATAQRSIKRTHVNAKIEIL